MRFADCLFFFISLRDLHHPGAGTGVGLLRRAFGRWSVRLAGLALVVATLNGASASAATISIVHHFDPDLGNGGVNTFGQLLLSSNTLYGLTYPGSGGNNGTVFQVNTDGTGFLTLVSFSGFLNVPTGTLLISDDGFELFGETALGGGGTGSIFMEDTIGVGPYYLHGFHTADGVNPSGALVLSSNRLYGTTTAGGSSGFGTVFSYATDTGVFTNLHSFTNRGGGSISDPWALVLSDNRLYGTTKYGGGSVQGSVFAINTDGSDYADLHAFTGPDGSFPNAGLLIAGDVLYGVTGAGGISGSGTLFRLNTSGSGFTNLFSFTNSPNGSLVLSGNQLYGTTTTGGSFGKGALFSIGLDGAGFTNVFNFDGTNGTNPTEALILSGGTLYGTTEVGGARGYGVLYALTVVAPRLDIASADNAVVLTWNEPGFTLQASPTVTGVFTNVIGAVSPYTNTIVGSQLYFRLAQ